jgi:hypothetical protein
MYDIDLLEAVTEAKIVIRRLADERNNVHVWEALFDKACEIASEFEMEATLVVAYYSLLYFLH